MSDDLKDFIEQLAAIREESGNGVPLPSGLPASRFVGEFERRISRDGLLRLPKKFGVQPGEQFFVGLAGSGHLIGMEAIALMKLTRDFQILIWSISKGVASVRRRIWCGLEMMAC